MNKKTQAYEKEVWVYILTKTSQLLYHFYTGENDINQMQKSVKEGNDDMKYVISDIHGRWDKYQSMLEKIAFSKNDKLYILGDVIDRGRDGIKILHDIRKHPNMYLLMGNHELMAVQTLLAKDEIEWNKKMDLWLRNGGGITFYHFLELSEEEQEEVAVYLSMLPGEMEVKVKDKVYHLVHGFPADTLEKQVWTRPTLETENPFQDKRLIVGHTPVILLHGNRDGYICKLRKKGEHVKIEHAKGFIDIDCGCGSGMSVGRLACLCLENMEEFYV